MLKAATHKSALKAAGLKTRPSGVMMSEPHFKAQDQIVLPLSGMAIPTTSSPFAQ